MGICILNFISNYTFNYLTNSHVASTLPTHSPPLPSTSPHPRARAHDPGSNTATAKGNRALCVPDARPVDTSHSSAPDLPVTSGTADLFLLENTLSWLSFSCWLLLPHFLCWLPLFYLIKFGSTSNSVLSPLFFSFYALLHSISFESNQLPWLQIPTSNRTQTPFFCSKTVYAITLLRSLTS